MAWAQTPFHHNRAHGEAPKNGWAESLVLIFPLADWRLKRNLLVLQHRQLSICRSHHRCCCRYRLSRFSLPISVIPSCLRYQPLLESHHIHFQFIIISPSVVHTTDSLLTHQTSFDKTHRTLICYPKKLVSSTPNSTHFLPTTTQIRQPVSTRHQAHQLLQGHSNNCIFSNTESP